jgi:hypothetical protein
MPKSARLVVARNLTLGTARFAKISAVEGLYLSAAAMKEFAEDEKRRATTAEQRRRILAKYAPKK